MSTATARADLGRSVTYRATTGSITTVLTAMLSLGGCFGCGGAASGPGDQSVQPSYDPQSGRLRELAYDASGNGRFDTWTEMDGARAVRSRIDTDGDGRVDRWEEYDERGDLIRVGFSRSRGDTPDAWAFAGPDGKVHRIEVSSRGGNRVDRWEYYDASEGAGGLVRAEEDTTGDGRPDKWETYSGGAIRTVAFDENGDGRPDRRLTYVAAGRVVVESDPGPSGEFTRRVEVR